MNNVITVSELNNYLKEYFDNNPLLRNFNIRGELSNVKFYNSGHLYFTLKDAESIISCVMFSFENSLLDFRPKDGDEVIIKGSVKVYPARGQYQLYVSKMDLAGKGDALLALKELKEKLYKEGLFDDSRKRNINQYPDAIGVIAGKDSAAYADIIKNIHRRYPIANIYFFPSLVQGDQAPKDLLRAFKLSQNYPLDTLIIARGGGSGEDLNAFNDETLVRALATSKFPVIAAVGHEIDFTLVDYVADKRVSTPTAAAELSCKNKDEIYDKFTFIQEKMNQSLTVRIKNMKDKLSLITSRPLFTNPKNMYQDKINKIENIKELLNLSISHYLSDQKTFISNKKIYLEAISPNNILDKGYSLVYDKDMNLIKNINQINNEDIINTRLKDGIIKSRIIETKKEGK